MKKCSYCGAEYPDGLKACPIDQTPFDDDREENSAAALSDVLNWTPKSALGLAITSGLAALLICTGIFYGGSKILTDYSGLWKHAAASTAASARTGFYVVHTESHPAHSMIRLSYVSLFSLGALIFTFFVCLNRCRKTSHGIVTAIIAFGIIGILTFLPLVVPISISFFLWVVPLLMLLVITKVSASIYIGAAIQIIVGVWLLGCFGKRKAPDALEITPLSDQ